MEEHYYVNKKEAMEKCMSFMVKLNELLKDYYEFDISPISKQTCHLIPNGTAEENTYYSKPLYSFRCSDHWNWYASTKKCNVYWYVQCFSPDVFWPEKRKNSGATKPRYCTNVSFFGYDQKFHCVYGEKFDRKTKTYIWIESDPEEVATMAINLLKEQEEKDKQALDRIFDKSDIGYVCRDWVIEYGTSSKEDLDRLNETLNYKIATGTCEDEIREILRDFGFRESDIEEAIFVWADAINESSKKMNDEYKEE